MFLLFYAYEHFFLIYECIYKYVDCRYGHKTLQIWDLKDFSLMVMSKFLVHQLISRQATYS